MTKAKICGLMRPQDIDAVNEAHPEMAGFVFANTRRQVTSDLAHQFRERLADDITSVGVFIEPDLDLIRKLADQHTIGVVQIHGAQNQAQIEAIQAMGLKVTQVVHPGDELITNPDFVMYDGQNPGSGQLIDWGKITKPDKPVFLAGGLNPDNVAIAIKAVHPDYVDVSSGVETDKQKDPHKIKQFTTEAHNG